MEILSVMIAPGGGGGVLPYMGYLYRYVPPDRVWFLRFPILKLGIIFPPFGVVFPVLSLDRVAKLYQPKRVVRKRAAQEQKRIDQLKPNYHHMMAYY